MSYRQQQENEEEHNHFLVTQEKFDNGDLDCEYSDWLINEHDLNPRICNRETLMHHMEAQTRCVDFIHEIAFGKQKLNS